MSEKHYSNIEVLRNFVHSNDLQDSHSNIEFNCIYYIVTDNNQENVNATARITFDNFNSHGEVIVNTNLDSNDFPRIFKAKYNDMKSKRNVLTITDKHPNPNIGNYKAVITALERTR